MTEGTHFYEPRLGHRLAHDPFNSIVAPRPIGWVSTRDAAGRLNLAPYSFFNAFNYTPPIIGFASVGVKDSLRNVRAVGEFVWNLATRPLAAAMNATSATGDVDEFAVAELTPAPSRVVSVPRVEQSPVSFECRVSQIVALCAADGAEVGSWLVLGEVVGVHIAERLVAGGSYDTTAAEPITRGGGPADYFQITADQLFHMRRPV